MYGSLVFYMYVIVNILRSHVLLMACMICRRRDGPLRMESVLCSLFASDSYFVPNSTIYILQTHYRWSEDFSLRFHIVS